MPDARPVGDALASSAIHDSALLCTFVVIFVLVAISFKQILQLSRRSVGKLWSLRRRDNVFDERVGGSWPYEALLLVQYAVYSGLLIYCGARYFAPVPTLYSAKAAFACIGLSVAYYAFQVAAYSTVGFAFATPQRSSQWLTGLNASLSLLGIALVIPVLTMLFYPGLAAAMLAVGATLWIAARLFFIVKGFRIFYNNFGSLLYFILYLCTLEIIPLVYLCAAALLIVDNIV